MIFRLVLPSLLSVALISCDLTSCDHAANAAMERELNERSKQGLALARVTFSGERKPLLRLHFFDGRYENRNLACCQNLNDPSIAGNRILMIDQPSEPDVDPAFSMSGLRGGYVVILNARGAIVDRTDMRVQTGLLAVSPDRKQFVFVGAPAGHALSEAGVYIASFHGRAIKKLRDLGPDRVYTEGESFYPALRQRSLDWSPRGDAILFSEGDAVLSIDPGTGQTRKIADGCGARWSPSGDQITYVTPPGQGFLLTVRTGELKAIDRGKSVPLPMEWSPDGRYLLIAEGKGSHVPNGCFWVYRLSDGAFVPVLNYTLSGAHPYWIDLKG